MGENNIGAPKILYFVSQSWNIGLSFIYPHKVKAYPYHPYEKERMSTNQKTDTKNESKKIKNEISTGRRKKNVDYFFKNIVKLTIGKHQNYYSFLVHQ